MKLRLILILLSLGVSVTACKFEVDPPPDSASEQGKNSDSSLIPSPEPETGVSPQPPTEPSQPVNPPPSVQAKVYYVAPSGRDTNEGSQSSPFQTLTHAVSKLTPGSTLYLRAGIYKESLPNTIPSGISKSSPTLISGFEKEKVTLLPEAPKDSPFASVISISNQQFIHLRNLDVDATHAENGISVRQAKSIQLSDIKIISAVNYGLKIYETDTSTFSRLYIHYNAHRSTAMGAGIGIYSGSNNTIDGCILSSNKFAGIFIMPVPDFRNPKNLVISKSLFADNQPYGIQSRSLEDSKIINNVFASYGKLTPEGVAQTQGAGLIIDGGFGVNSTKNIQVVNNTFFRNRYPLRDLTTAVKYQNNISFGHDMTDELLGVKPENQSYNLIGIDPQFIDAEKSDFRLKATSSAINNGVISPIVVDDFLGKPRPVGKSHDIGAHEFQ